MQRGLLAKHAQGDLVAFGAAGSRSAHDLLRDVAAVSLALPSAPKGSEALLVIRHDRYALAVSILAAWARDYVVVLPPELDRDAITTLASAAQTACVLHDTASGIPLQVSALLERAHDVVACTPDVWQHRELASHGYARNDQGVLEPTNAGAAWLEQARTLSELVALAPGQRCATSVAPGHAHGIVLGVLVPLLTGCAFLREPLSAQKLGSALAEHTVDVLVSVPAHLRELREGAAQSPFKLQRVISALEPLSPALAAELDAIFAAQVSDLSHAAAQVPLLQGEPEPPGSLPDERAADARLNQFLRAQPGVRDAAVLRVGSAASARRLCVALTGEGLDLGTLSALRTALAAERELHGSAIDLLALGKIRRDALGQVQRHELLRQFGLRADGSPVSYALHWGATSSRTQGDVVEHSASVHIPVDYGYFDGHFAGYPILPGAAQLSALVLPYVRQVRPELTRLASMSRLKFSGRIQPGETIEVVLTGRPDASAVEFALRRGATLCSAGTLSFRAGGEP